MLVLTRKFAGIRSPRRPSTASAAARQRGVALQVRVAVAEHQLSGGEPLEPVADLQLVGHDHAAVQLHGLLPDESAGLTDDRLGRRHRPPPPRPPPPPAPPPPPPPPPPRPRGKGRGVEESYQSRLFEMNQHVRDA